SAGWGVGRLIASVLPEVSLIGGSAREFGPRRRNAHPPGAAHLERHFLELASVLLQSVGHLCEGAGRDPIVGPRREVAQLIGPFPPILRPVERVRHAPETGHQLRMFPARATCEIRPHYSRPGGCSGPASGVPPELVSATANLSSGDRVEFKAVETSEGIEARRLPRYQAGTPLLQVLFRTRFRI